MDVKYDFKAAGLQEAGKLRPGDTFINGGLMNTPNVFLVTEGPNRPWIPPNNRGPKMTSEAENEMYVKVFNITQGHSQRFGADKLVSKVKCVLTVIGAGYCPYTADCSSSKRSEEINEEIDKADYEKPGEYIASWKTQISADSAYDAARKAKKMISNNDTATVFIVESPNGSILSVNAVTGQTKREDENE